MVEYQNIFTQVQVQGPPEMGSIQRGGLQTNAPNAQAFRSWQVCSVTRSWGQSTWALLVSCRWQQVRCGF